MPLPWNPKKIGEKGEDLAKEILLKEGFTDLRKHRIKTAPYDYRAKKDGKLCFVEVRYRSPKAKTQMFTFRDTKIRHLRKSH